MVKSWSVLNGKKFLITRLVLNGKVLTGSQWKNLLNNKIGSRWKNLLNNKIGSQCKNLHNYKIDFQRNFFGLKIWMKQKSVFFKNCNRCVQYILEYIYSLTYLCFTRVHKKVHTTHTCTTCTTYRTWVFCAKKETDTQTDRQQLLLGITTTFCRCSVKPPMMMMGWVMKL